MITRQHTQEALCRAHLIALAGLAGANYELQAGFDYGVDCTIRGVAVNPSDGRRIGSGFSIELQLKSSTRWQLEEDSVVYDLEAKTWNDLVSREVAAIPLYLVLLCLPADDDDWLNCSEDQLVLKNCCYFYRPQGQPRTENTASVRIRIPRMNLFNSKAVIDLLRLARVEAKGDLT